MHGAPQAFVEERRRNPLIRLVPTANDARTCDGDKTAGIQIADIVNEPDYFDVPSGYSVAH